MSSIVPNIIVLVIFVIVFLMGMSIVYIATNAVHSSDTCNAQEFTELKMSTITLTKYPIPFVNIQDTVVDEDGVTYIIYDNMKSYKQFDGHNVTFAYNCYNGQKAITGILMDNDGSYNVIDCNKTTCMNCGYKVNLQWNFTKDENCQVFMSSNEEIDKMYLSRVENGTS